MVTAANSASPTCVSPFLHGQAFLVSPPTVTVKVSSPDGFTDDDHRSLPAWPGALAVTLKLLPRLSGHRGLGRLNAAVIFSQGAQADDVAGTAAVGEIAIDGIGQEGTGGEVAEDVGELRPAGHQRRFVEQRLDRDAVARCRVDRLWAGLGRNADKGSRRCADGFDGLGPAVDFFDINAWGCV